MFFYADCADFTDSADFFLFQSAKICFRLFLIVLNLVICFHEDSADSADSADFFYFNLLKSAKSA
ncbi:hypothetical protein AB674_15845 [Flavobacterium sp. ABG]|nr:hypothetical protein AB674_15845 [Flavobacterium sp. ABG]